jgi:hypothetical protein
MTTSTTLKTYYITKYYTENNENKFSTISAISAIIQGMGLLIYVAIFE